MDTTTTGHDDAAHHVSDELPRLLLGEADRTTVRRVAVHLRACTDCRDDLVDAVVAHATLRSAALTARDVATGGRLAADDADLRAPWLVDPLLAGASAGVEAADLPALLDDLAARTPVRQPVDLGPVFAQIRAEAVAADTPSAPAADDAPDAPAPAPSDQLAARRGRRTRLALSAAAAVVVLGGGTAVAVTTLSDSGKSVTVSAYGAGTVDASARVGDGWVKLDASSLKRLTSDHYYEAWLVNADSTGVIALGPLGGDGKATFSVPPDVMSQYPTLQVTVQDNDGDPRPSQTSVLRASL